MEPIFGAFIAGTMISASRIAQRQLAALRTLVLSVLAPLFLATAGLRVDVTVLARPVVALTALVIVLVAILGKFAGAYAGARLRRLSSPEGIALGAGMNARGVIEVVIALTGLRLGVLNNTTYTIVVLVALVTSIMAPPVLRHAMSRITQTDEELIRKIEHDTWDGTSAYSTPPRHPGRPTKNAFVRSTMVYSPVACVRVISVCWRAASLGCFPLSCMVPLLSFAGIGPRPVAVFTHFGS